MEKDYSKFDVLILDGCEGKSIYMNDYRMAGNKPWGGAPTIFKGTVETKDLVRALGVPRMNILIEEYAKAYPWGFKELNIDIEKLTKE